MKAKLSILTAISLALPLQAEFEMWTNKDGKAVELELIEVTGEGDAKSGVFMMRNGRKATIAMKDLDAESAERLAAWKPPAAEAETVPATPSVFDEILDGNLVILDGKRLKRHEPTSKPTKYYVFYYTASWCPPCQAFTPSLVDFYRRNKRDNDNFELVLISSDSDEDAMEGYAKDKKMPWPQLKHSKVKRFKSKFNHGVRGIPSVIVCDLDGKIVSREGRNLDILKDLVK